MGGRARLLVSTTAMDWTPLRSSSKHVVLPSDQQKPTRSWTLHWKRRRCRLAHPTTLRRLLFCLACTPILVLVAILCQGFPPSYNGVRTFERRLPQHAVATLTRPNDRPVRYLKFPGHLWGHGLNNILQEAFVLRFGRFSARP